jgi:hypothetical protein
MQQGTQYNQPQRTPQGMQQRPRKNRIKLIIPLALIVGIAIPAIFYFYPEYQRNQLLEKGIPAEGTILRLEDTGNRFNDQPQVKLWLEVRPQGAPAFETVTKMVISPVYMPQFQPGAIVQLRYDPEDNTKVAIEAIGKAAGS